MIVLVTGGRDHSNYSFFVESIRLAVGDKPITEIVEGGNRRGADAEARLFATSRGIPNKTFHADWNTFGRAAGPIRNKKMAEYLAAVKEKEVLVLAIWDGKSPGTGDMIAQAKKFTLPYRIFYY